MSPASFLLGWGLAQTWWCVLPWLLTGLLSAQVKTAQIDGTVFKPGGEPVARASIVVTDTSNGFVGRTQASASGDYSISGLKPGAYTITASSPGLGTESRTLVLPVDFRS